MQWLLAKCPNRYRPLGHVVIVGKVRISPGDRLGLRVGKEAVDDDDLHEPGLEVDDRNQICDERHLEGRAVPLDHETGLGRPVLDTDHDTANGTHLATDEVFGPILPLVELSGCGDEDVLIADRLGAFTSLDAFECHLPPFVATAQSADGQSGTGDIDLRAGLEVNEIGLVDIEADVSVETVGAAQTGDPDWISRRTQRRR